MKTTDGGSSWKYQTSGTGNTLIHSSFIDANTGWIAGHNGVILKTINGGNNWQIQSSGYLDNYFNTVFKNENTGWVVGDAGIFKTTNGGANWNRQLNEQWVYSVSFINENTGWAGVRFGKIFKTTNGGTNWIQKPSGSGATFYSLSFRSEQNGYAVGDYNTIIRTTDGGESWFPSNSGISNPYQKFSCISFDYPTDLIGWISGFDGVILRTMDGGETWVRQEVPINVDYNSIKIISNSVAYAAGGYGVVIKTSNGDATTAINTNTETAKNFILKQNYPNPFNPVTNLEFGISKLGFVSLKIYDVLGKEVAVIVNNNVNPGTYKYNFDGSNLVSGVYFYRLEAGDFTDVKRMVLVK